MQYKVPQNVDIEDKVIGPLTLRQFMIMLIAVGIIVILNFMMVGALRLLFWLVAMFICAIAITFSFVRYGDQRLEIFAFSAYKTLTKPRKRVWKKESIILQETHKAAPAPEQKETHKKNLDEARNDFQRLAEVVDSGGFSTLGGKDRITATTSIPTNDQDVEDIIAKAENPNSGIDQFIKAIKPFHKAEPTIAEQASISPNQEFEYDKIKVKV